MPETTRRRWITALALPALLLWGAGAFALVPPGDPGQPLDSTTIPKYVDPLIVPPAMPNGTAATSVFDPKSGQTADNFEISVWQFDQQILPSGFYPATTVWSYGPADDLRSVAEGGVFNYPSFTIEATQDVPTRVKWINNLVDAAGNPLPHLLKDSDGVQTVVDQTLHWANPARGLCADGTTRTDCRGTDPAPYQGAVPIVTHVHGAHVGPESDGYPEAWWLPAGVDPAAYDTSGTLFDDYLGTPEGAGYAVYQYPNDQKPTTLWYHDHSLGMTRLNVYAGPAGFFLIRGAEEAALGFPGMAPQLGEAPVGNYFELPLAIQDRSFYPDGSLFYPDSRAFFEGLTTLGSGGLDIGFIGDPDGSGRPSDINAIWNPEAFFNTMVVNGRTWPVQEVGQGSYRLRLLDGCNSRFLILKLVTVAAGLDVNDPANWVELTDEFTQLGAEGGLLPSPVVLDEVLMGPAERADVLVDFSGLADGTAVYLVNVGPDEPFGGGVPDVDFPAADPATTGQVMKFVVNAGLTAYAGSGNPVASYTPPATLTTITPLVAGDGAGNFTATATGQPVNKQILSLNEEVSSLICAEFAADGTITDVTPASGAVPGSATFEEDCINYGIANGLATEPMGPKAALLGTYTPSTDGVTPGVTKPMLWADPTSENPRIDDTEVWEIWNFTMDAHPIHQHLVQYQVLDREGITFDAATGEVTGLDGAVRAPEPWERGWKDTTIMYPGEVTRLAANFDKAGLYVWHCHIVEHEDNEMMRPYMVKYSDDLNGDGRVNLWDLRIMIQVLRSHFRDPKLYNLAYDLDGNNVLNIRDAFVLLRSWTG
jgi:FtsP/CotA-like multicopper oxidase with cupredoxin domain